VPKNSSRPSTSAENAKTPGNHLLSGELTSTLEKAFAYAKGRRHEFITVEHLLLFLLEDAQTSRVLKGSGVNLDDLQKQLTDRMDINPLSQATDGTDNPQPTLGFQRVLQRAVFHVQSAGLA
jgi:ATP-dependent Clp protease ATP-binding subunit ClpA